MICYTALLVYRLLEAKLEVNRYHFTTDNIIETLQNIEVANINDMFYASTYTASSICTFVWSRQRQALNYASTYMASSICTALNAVFPLELDKKYYAPKELNKKLKKDVSRGLALTSSMALLMMVNGFAPILAPVVGGLVL